MYRIISLLVLTLFALTEARITACDSPLGQVNIDDVSITNCRPDDDKCILQRASNITIQFPFTITQPVGTVQAVVHGILMGVPVPFPLPDDKVCDDPEKSGIHCPLSPEQGTFHYSASLPVQKKYPRVSVDVKWELQNENGVNIACLLIPSKLK